MPKATRRSAIVAKPKPATNQYYVFNPTLKHLGGALVRDDGAGNNIVLLTAADAQYWIDQGVIGELPLNEQAAKGTLVQMGRIRVE